MLRPPPEIGARAVLRAVRERLIRPCDERGLSLVEVLVAAVVLGIAAVGVALMFSTGQAFINGEGDSRISLFLAQQKVERLRASGYGELNRLALSTGFVVQTDTLTNHPSYSRTWKLECFNRDNFAGTPLEDCPGNAAVRIRVTVQTTPVDIKARPVTLFSVVSPKQ